MVEQVLAGLDREVKEVRPLRYRCRCSRERLLDHLVLLPAEDRDYLRARRRRHRGRLRLLRHALPVHPGRAGIDPGRPQGGRAALRYNPRPHEHLLRHHPDLLRQRAAPHRAHLHDHRRRRPGALPAAWRGEDVYFLTGTDEHGQNIERAARNEGIAPIALADRVVAKLPRAARPAGLLQRRLHPHHRGAPPRGVEEIIRRIEAAGDLYTAAHEGWYCPPCETFYTEKELGPEKTCPVHGTPVEWKSEENVFFRLSKYQQPLLDLYESIRSSCARRPA